MLTVLGIESSCDETAVAVIREDGHILSQTLASQHDAHAPFGGVVPEIAARAHLTQMLPLYRQALMQSGCALGDIDAIAATAGPGLIGGVLVGLSFAKALAAGARKPFVAVNHLEGHALTVRFTHQARFPYYLLLISGGHCQQLVVRGVGDYHRLGGTRDDALGEAFDKCAKMLGLPFPGGPALAQAAQRGDPFAFSFPRPLLQEHSFDFSFSGLKTAVRRKIEELAAQSSTLGPQAIADIAASFQHTVGEVLRVKVDAALAAARAQYPQLTAAAVAGGVAANTHLRAQLAEIAAAHGLPLLVAPPALCTDNAAMIAWAGLERFRLGQRDGLESAARARWPLSETALTQRDVA